MHIEFIGVRIGEVVSAHPLRSGFDSPVSRNLMGSDVGAPDGKRAGN